ncbi:GGDEF domain-containing protein [Candidatus Halobeggiatoa sp. HSG11]|nr:GGDEF domain-containing protein [Candidatus Halobeggiatoa sp. HSG11]
MNIFKIHSIFSSLPMLRKSYAIKIMSVALFGIFMPFFMLVCYLMINSSLNLNDNFNIIIVVFLATLIGMVASLSLLYLLVLPIQAILTGLQQYLNKGKKPIFPTDSGDSVGQLMILIQYMIEKLDLLNSSLKFSDMVDPLTGIPNRRNGEERLYQDMARISRENKQILVAILDVNQTNIVNECYGYELGDVCLIHIVETLLKSIRKGDWIARWDDNQFLIVLWNFNDVVSTTVLERIQQQSIKTNPIEELLNLELSIGACIYEGIQESDNQVNQKTLITCLDEALTQAKQTDKGGIVLAEKIL